MRLTAPALHHDVPPELSRTMLAFARSPQHGRVALLDVDGSTRWVSYRAAIDIAVDAPHPLGARYYQALDHGPPERPWFHFLTAAEDEHGARVVGLCLLEGVSPPAIRFGIGSIPAASA